VIGGGGMSTPFLRWRRRRHFDRQWRCRSAKGIILHIKLCFVTLCVALLAGRPLVGMIKLILCKYTIWLGQLIHRLVYILGLLVCVYMCVLWLKTEPLLWINTTSTMQLVTQNHPRVYKRESPYEKQESICREVELICGCKMPILAGTVSPEGQFVNIN